MWFWNRIKHLFYERIHRKRSENYTIYKNIYYKIYYAIDGTDNIIINTDGVGEIRSTNVRKCVDCNCQITDYKAN